MTTTSQNQDSSTEASLWTRCEDVVDTQVHDETVLMSVRTGKYLFMNRTASVIWELLNSPQSMTQIIEVMTQRFAVDETRCQAEVSSLLTRLENAHMVARQVG